MRYFSDTEGPIGSLSIAKVAPFLLCFLLLFSSHVVADDLAPELERGCRCNGKMMDILSIKAMEYGIDIMRLTFNRANCGDYPRCGGYCDFQFDGKTVTLDIPCEPFERDLDKYETYTEISSSALSY